MYEKTILIISILSKKIVFMIEIFIGWWARLGSNQQPPRCQRDALPLSYAPFLQVLSLNL